MNSKDLEKIKKYVEEKEYEVGYKKPPKSTQFKKGQSGNPAGRKKKPKPESIYQAFVLLANETQTVQINEYTSKKMNMVEILVNRVFQDAIKKDGNSRKFLLNVFLKENVRQQYESIIENLTQNATNQAEQEALKSVLIEELDTLLKEQQELEDELNSQNEE